MGQDINRVVMRRKTLRKSEVLREGYDKGLRHAQRIINDMLREEQLNEGWGSQTWEGIKSAFKSVGDTFKNNMEAKGQAKAAKKKS